MTRSDLVNRLAQRFSQLTQRDTEFAVKTMLDAMSDALARGDRIEIRGFGSFALNYRPPRVGRNPKSGEKVQVPAKYVPHFKAGKELRERVAQATNNLDALYRVSMEIGANLELQPRLQSIATIAARLLAAVAGDPHRPLERIDLLSPAELDDLRATPARTRVPRPDTQLVTTMVAERVAALADIGVTDFAAVEFGATPDEVNDTRNAVKSLLK
mgnify:CR=1 FL=1